MPNVRVQPRFKYKNPIVNNSSQSIKACINIPGCWRSCLRLAIPTGQIWDNTGRKTFETILEGSQLLLCSIIRISGIRHQRYNFFLSPVTQTPLWTSGNSCQLHLKNDSLPVGKGLLLNWAYETEIYQTQPGYHCGDRCPRSNSLRQSWSGSLQFYMCQQSFSNTAFFLLMFSLLFVWTSSGSSFPCICDFWLLKLERAILCS